MNQTVGLIDLLNRRKLIIPIIQRDYAQGRKDSKATDIRNKFLHDIFDAIEGRANSQENKTLELDFVYGFTANGSRTPSFCPIDGQQRLTTLWLLYWYVSQVENITDEARFFLKNFTYQTRHSTNIFIDKLINFKFSQENSEIDEDIKDQPWYFNAWNYDPGIQAMLVMLKDIDKHYKSLNLQQVWQILTHVSSPIKFHLLEMENIGLPDDLYIKMNSRGKPLTEFEYFKTGFLEIIKDYTLRERFETDIDGKWYEYIWDIILNGEQEVKTDLDLSDISDACFLRFINYVTGLLAFRSSLPFTEINFSMQETAAIYQRKENLLFLFNALDALTTQIAEKPEFWNQYFYYQKDDSGGEKVRLYFFHNTENLFKRCLFNYDRSGRAFSLPEQVLLYACLLQLMHNTSNFDTKIRVIRNLAVNSDNEMRLATIKIALDEIWEYLLTGDLEVFTYFKRDQIAEEKEKGLFIEQQPSSKSVMLQLEDSHLLRGCISIFDFDDSFRTRAIRYLHLFDEVNSDWHTKGNLLLCFGDYSQDDGDYLTNLLSQRVSDWRRFFTTPGYNKEQLTRKTKVVLLDCIDFFIANPEQTIEDKISKTLSDYHQTVKDWKYYFLKYPGLRHNCNQGYYYWIGDNEYVFQKMKERQFNGQHWDPIIQEIKVHACHTAVELGNYGEMLELTIGTNLLKIGSIPSGFRVENNNQPGVINTAMTALIDQGLITEEGEMHVRQVEGKDLDDRVVQGAILVNEVLKLVGKTDNVS